MGCSSSKYKRSYPPSTTTTASSQVKAHARDGDCAFFQQARARAVRDYILVIDRSGSMSGSNWEEARAAVEFFAAAICEFDPDGITLILFDDSVLKFKDVKDPDRVKELFETYTPCGTTNLAAALDTAFEEHFGGKRGASSVFVVTDGSPDSTSDVEKVIRKAANSITSDEELSVSFVQVGLDSGAKAFLKHLDDSLNGIRYDIVDVVVPSDLKEMSFTDVVRKSMSD